MEDDREPLVVPVGDCGGEMFAGAEKWNTKRLGIALHTQHHI
jgi:hypothetical protein